MITRIELTNFMSHAHTVIEPAAGLTVLVGANNVGKSAVVAALQILCHNENSTYVMRHGAKQCSVTLETDDGHRIEWRRKNSPSYLIDGQNFDRLKGSGLPDELHRALRLPKVDAGSDTDFDVHFGTQKSPIFLLGSSAANAARFFASSSDAIRLVAIQKLHKEKLAEAQREKGRLETESKRINTELELLEPAVEIDHRLAAAELAHQELTQQEIGLRELERCQADLLARAGQVACDAAQFNALSSLAPPPEFNATDPLQRLLDALATAEQRVAAAQGRWAAFVELEAPPLIGDVAPLERLTAGLIQAAIRVAQGEAEAQSLAAVPRPPELSDCEALFVVTARLVAAAHELTTANDRCQILAGLATPPELPAERPLSMLTAGLLGCNAAMNRWEQTLTALEAAGPPPVAVDARGMIELISQLETTAVQLERCQQDCTTINESLAVAAQELRSAAVDGSCSICGAPLDPDRVLARAAAGQEAHDHG